MENWDFLFLATIVDKQLFVSPKTKMSGFNSSSIGSILIRILPIVLFALPVAHSRKISVFCSNSLKTSFKLKS